MMKQEFEKLLGANVTTDEYDKIEKVYMSIEGLSKGTVVDLYKMNNDHTVNVIAEICNYINACESKITELVNEIASLQDTLIENETLKSEIKDLKIDLAVEKEVSCSKDAEYEKAKTKMRLLQDTIARLQSENEVLENDNENLIADLQDYETENAKLIAENEVLQNKITNLENENDELKTQLHQYQALFSDIERKMTVNLYESLLGIAAN